MDPLAALYYGAICALVALFAPELKRVVVRVAVGFAIGLLAAALLPLLKGALGA